MGEHNQGTYDYRVVRYDPWIFQVGDDWKWASIGILWGPIFRTTIDSLLLKMAIYR